MDYQLVVMLDLEKALSMLSGNNMYLAGLNFFYALGYPVEPLEIAINESMYRFVYVIIPNRCAFSNDETGAMNSVTNISWLFTLSNETPTLNHIQNVKTNKTNISSINYFSVDLDCRMYDRSTHAFVITKIINKVIKTPVVVLFKHKNKLLLAASLFTYEEDVNYHKTYLSDWITFNPIQENILIDLSKWDFGNCCNKNFYTFFADLVYYTTRSYFLNPKKIKQVKYQNSTHLKDPFFYDEMIMINGECFFNTSDLDAQNVEITPRELYRHDYIDNEESIEILSDISEGIMEEMLHIDEFNDEHEDKNFEYNKNNLQHKNQPHDTLAEQTSIDLKNINDTIINDPIKLLRYLEKIDETN